jgi:hypothetical protein
MKNVIFISFNNSKKKCNILYAFTTHIIYYSNILQKYAYNIYLAQYTINCKLSI